MRDAFVPGVAAALVLLSSPAPALEKRSVPFDDSGSESWAAGATCRVSYYNICTGWIWCWGPLIHHMQFGVVADACCPDGQAALSQTTHFLCTGAPPNYGYTGSIAVYAVDTDDCPLQPPISSQPYLPAYNPFPFQIVNWGGVPVPSRFAVIVTVVADPGHINPASFATDHPAAGPTGPPACGTCYPADRPNHSFMYFAAGSPVCPGIPISDGQDGICDAQLFWDIDLSCTVSVEESSWGKIKGLYR